jgi:hypothetical protein
MGSRSRKRGRDRTTPQPPVPVPEPESDPVPNRYARNRAKDEAIRQGLQPLEPGERPRAVTVAAILAFFLAAANLVATFTVKGLSSDQGNPTTFALLWTGLLVIAGAGMLARRYWAVLGFECILGLQIIIFTLALTRVQKWWLAIAMVVAIGLMGWLFWKLIRPMARLQMPDRPGSAESNR